jgi:hypothetical protein
MQSLMQELLKDAYDLHVHCEPDVVPRAQDIVELAIAASAAGMSGIGLKDHTTSTVGRCYALNRWFPDGPRFFSSIALNPPVGGLNPAAVEAALASGVDIVYFPTYSAAHHIDVLGEHVTPVPHPSGGVQRLTVVASNSAAAGLREPACERSATPASQDPATALLPEVVEIIDLIASHDAVLATGHISPQESLALLERAAASGVRRMVVTHASQSVPNMSVDDQQRSVQWGALIEHCFLAVTQCCPGTIPLCTIADQIRAVGHQHVILSSDFGQLPNGPPVDGFAGHVERLQALGFKEAELRVMLSDNPGCLVGNRDGGK